MNFLKPFLNPCLLTIPPHLLSPSAAPMKRYAPLGKHRSKLIHQKRRELEKQAKGLLQLESIRKKRDLTLQKLSAVYNVRRLLLKSGLYGRVTRKEYC